MRRAAGGIWRRERRRWWVEKKRKAWWWMGRAEEIRLKEVGWVGVGRRVRLILRSRERGEATAEVGGG